MPPKYNGTEIKQAPLSILQLIRRDLDRTDENGVKVRDMMDELNLSRGSVNNYLTGTLEPLGMVGVTDTEETAGAASDANLWGISKDAYRWLDSLGPDDLAPVEASGEAVKRAERAVEIANEARSTAESQEDRVEEAHNEIEQMGKRADNVLNGQSGRINDLRSDLDDIRDTAQAAHTAANRPDQTLYREIYRVDQQLRHIYNLHLTEVHKLTGDPDNEDDVGRVGKIEQSIEAQNESYTDLKDRVKSLRKRKQHLTYAATGAVILAAIAIALTLI